MAVLENGDNFFAKHSIIVKNKCINCQLDGMMGSLFFGTSFIVVVLVYV